ncbi:MAG: hypothetical protein RSB98_04695 [Raoultibacter sp.]
MKKILYSWIEQILGFDTMDELNRYVDDQKRLAESNGQAAVQVIYVYPCAEGFVLGIRKPYNKNPMPQLPKDYKKEE